MRLCRVDPRRDLLADTDVPRRLRVTSWIVDAAIHGTLLPVGEERVCDSPDGVNPAAPGSNVAVSYASSSGGLGPLTVTKSIVVGQARTPRDLSVKDFGALVTVDDRAAYDATLSGGRVHTVL